MLSMSQVGCSKHIHQGLTKVNALEMNSIWTLVKPCMSQINIMNITIIIKVE